MGKRADESLLFLIFGYSCLLLTGMKKSSYRCLLFKEMIINRFILVNLNRNFADEEVFDAVWEIAKISFWQKFWLCLS